MPSLNPDYERDLLREAKMRRRRFLLAGAGSVVAAAGAWHLLSSNEATEAARAERLPDGRPRLPPGQRVIDYLKPMGGVPGDPSPSKYKLKVHGLVDEPYELDFEQLLAMPQFEGPLDVHCVTGWSRLGGLWTGVPIKVLAERAGVSPKAKFVIFEAAKGYTANVRLEDALADDSLVAHRYEGNKLAQRHGAPVRSLVPSLYFWKSAKWLTGIRFVERDVSGYWEVRGYHNRADPWQEQRYG